MDKHIKNVGLGIISFLLIFGIVKNHLSKTGGMNLPHLENHLIFDDYQKHKVSEASCGF